MESNSSELSSSSPQFAFLDWDSCPLFEEGQQVSSLKKALINPAGASAFGVQLGQVPHPIVMQNAIALMAAVNIHETCILTKRDATVGLGFETEADRQKQQKQQELDQFNHEVALGRQKMPGSPPVAPAKTAKADPPPTDQTKGPSNRSPVDEKLDPLCEDGFQTLLNQVGEDYKNTGNGYIEVVRDGSSIVSLWHIPAPAVHVFLEAERPNRHFEIQGVNSSPVKMARFGDAEELRRRIKLTGQTPNELIHFKAPTARSRYYGLPEWLSCVPWLELAQMMMQYNFDYFQNRAVPDLMVLLTGAQLPQQHIDALKAALKETVGAGKRHRTLVVQIPGVDVKAQIERLNADNREKFKELWETVQLQIVSAHRVPPLLAGVTLPGKMAAANELPNALIAFQTLYIDQHQKIFSRTLGETLGSSDAGLGLSPEDFVFKKITDYYDMGQVDTMSRMRQTATDAQMQGRKLEDGLKK